MEKPREQILYTNIQVNLYFIIMVKLPSENINNF